MDDLQKEIIEHLDEVGEDDDPSKPRPFDSDWVKEAHKLLMLLLSVRAKDPDEEWEDFLNLFRVGRAKELSDGIWPTRKTEPVLRDWRRYRDMTRDLVRARQPADWLQIAKRYPTDLVERAMRTPPEKADRNETHRPADVMWIAWTYGLVNEIEYRECATPGCERYAAVSFPKRPGRQPRYCSVCNASIRDLSRHIKRKKDNDRSCWEIVRRALEKIPAKERRIASDKDRRVLAKRLFKVVSRELAKAPGKRGMRWIAKRLKPKGSNNEQN